MSSDKQEKILAIMEKAQSTNYKNWRNSISSKFKIQLLERHLQGKRKGKS